MTIKLTNCSFSNNTRDGIRNEGDADIHIENSAANNNGRDGISNKGNGSVHLDSVSGHGNGRDGYHNQQQVTFEKINDVFEYLGLDPQKVDTSEFKRSLEILEKASSKEEMVRTIENYDFFSRFVNSSVIQDRSQLAANLLAIGESVGKVLKFFNS